MTTMSEKEVTSELKKTSFSSLLLVQLLLLFPTPVATTDIDHYSEREGNDSESVGSKSLDDKPSDTVTDTHKQVDDDGVMQYSGPS